MFCAVFLIRMPPEHAAANQFCCGASQRLRPQGAKRNHRHAVGTLVSVAPVHNNSQCRGFAAPTSINLGGEFEQVFGCFVDPRHAKFYFQCRPAAGARVNDCVDFKAAIVPVCVLPSIRVWFFICEFGPKGRTKGLWGNADKARGKLSTLSGARF